MHLHHPTYNHPLTSLPLPLSRMARTSRDPFSPPPSSAPMKKNGGRRKKAVGVSAVVKAAGSAGTPKNKKASAKQKNNNRPELSDLDETPFNQRKGPPEDIMPSLIPHTRQNDLCTPRNHFRSHPLMFIFCQLMEKTCSSPLLRTRIVTLSITRLPTITHLHPLLRWQHVRHHQPMHLKTMTRRKASILKTRSMT